jgi:hypothetical protein
MSFIPEQARLRAARVRRLRRVAAADGLRLIKYRDGSRWFNQYGPYALVDVSTDVMVAWGLPDLAAVERELTDRRADASTRPTHER